MSSHITCCGCWPAFVRGFQGSSRSGRTYRRAKYNEKEYTIEFENLIEEDDFYAPANHIVTDVERDLLSRGKFGELLQHENEISFQQDAKLKQAEENARLEDEAYIQAKKEAARVARQAIKKQINDKFKNAKMSSFDSSELSSWLTQEQIDITSPELDVEDFESFLEKVRTKSAQVKEEIGRKKDDVIFEQSLSQGLEATKIAGDALNALQPVELHAVGFPSKDQPAFDASFDNRAYSHDESPVIHVPNEQPMSTSPHGEESPAVTATETLQLVEEIPVAETQSPLIDISPSQGSEEIDIITSTRQPDVIPQSVSQVVNVSSTSLISPATSTIAAQVVLPSSSASPQLIDTLLSPKETEDSINVQPITHSQPDINSLHDDEHPALHISSSQSSDNSLSQSGDAPTSQDHLHQCASESHFPVTQSSQLPSTSSSLGQSNSERSSPLSGGGTQMTTVVTINTPRNIATNLQPIDHSVENDPTHDGETQSLGSIPKVVVVTNDSHDDNDFNDFEDDFVSANSNGTFEDLLT